MKFKFLIYIILVTFLSSCSKDSNDDNATFVFQVEVQNVTDRAATITWTRPEGSNISFKIYLNDALIENNFGQTAYTFTGLLSETSYGGKITATDGSQTATVNFSFNTSTYSPLVFEGDVFLNSQAMINEFASHHYNEIRNSLRLSGSEIYDLSPLNDLKKVNQNVIIEHTNAPDFSGLENLEYIGGTLDIHYNSILKNLNSLEGLTHIGENLIFYSNFELEDINALSNVIGFNGAMNIEGSKITTLDIFNDTNEIENLYVGVNNNLRSIDGFRSVTTVRDYIDIYDNPNLITMAGLSSIAHINDNGLYIESNPSLQTIELVNLVDAGRNIDFSFNSNIATLDCFSNLTGTVDNIYILEQPLLDDFCGLTNTVLNMTGDLLINGNLYNPTLEDFQNGDCRL